MNIPLYCAISALIIMLWHFAMNTNPKNFGIFQMIGIFILGGAIGYAMDSTATGLMFSIVLSLIFI